MLLLLASSAFAHDAVTAARALVHGEFEASVAAAASVPEAHEDYEIAALIEVEASWRLDRPRSTIKALRRAHRDPDLFGLYHLVASATYHRVGRSEVAEDFLDRVAYGNPWEPEAYARWVSISRPKPREVLGAVHALGLPDRVDKWFEPSLTVLSAAAHILVCRPDGTAVEAAAQRDLEGLEAELSAALALDDRALWARWYTEPEWPHSGLRYLAEVHPVNQRFAEVDVRTGWARSVLVEAHHEVRGAQRLARTYHDRLVAFAARCSDPPEGRSATRCSAPPDYRYLFHWPIDAGRYRRDRRHRYWDGWGWHRQQRREQREGCFGSVSGRTAPPAPTR